MKTRQRSVQLDGQQKKVGKIKCKKNADKKANKKKKHESIKLKNSKNVKSKLK